MEETLNILFYLFIIITPFFDGLYFEKDFIPSAIILSILLMLEIINYKINKKKKLDKEKEETGLIKVDEFNLKVNKFIKNLIIMISIILGASLSTYILDKLIFNLSIDKMSILYGTFQILEMGLLATLCLFKIKNKHLQKQGEIFKEAKHENVSVLLSSLFMGLLMVFKTFYREGRFEATFYYANATAMFFLISLIICHHTKVSKKRSKILKILTVIVDVVAIILTDSRFTYLLLAFTVFVEILSNIIKKHSDKKDNDLLNNNINKEVNKEINKSKNKLQKIFDLRNIIVLIIITIILTLSFNLLLDIDYVINRFKLSTITKDIELRLSYIEEANYIIKDYPLGLGYEGYLNHQEIKENKYRLRLVHNLPYQICLNYGLVMLIVAIIYFIKYIIICVKNKKLLRYENLILLIFLMHSMLDIGTSFLALDNIIIILIIRNLFNEKIE